MPVDHPFHVHVNPFEVVEVLDSEKRPLTEENAFSEYGWHDTLLLRDGWTYKFRMKYDDFTGQFFQHCHILDHEDLGMMETIEIVKNLQAPVAPRAASSSHMAVPGPQFAGSWSLPDARGVIHRSDEFAGPTVLLFVRGKGCLHCLEQLNAFAKHSRDFEKAGAKLVVISTDDTATLRAAADADRATPFLFLSDGAADVFRRFGCDEAVATHGTFVLRDGGRIGWKSIGREPFTQADQVLEALGQPATKP